MRRSKFIRSAAVTTVSAFVLAASATACGQEKPADAKTAKPEAKAAAPAKPAPKTLDEVFVFLPDPVATVGNKRFPKRNFLTSSAKCRWNTLPS